jgi:hypothetical protein
MTWLIGLISAIGGLLLKLWQGRGPAPIVTEARELGAATEIAVADQQTIKTQQAEAQAIVDAPRTQADLVSSLKQGKF